jgi:hypothetical protein
MRWLRLPRSLSLSEISIYIAPFHSKLLPLCRQGTGIAQRFSRNFGSLGLI